MSCRMAAQIWQGKWFSSYKQRCLLGHSAAQGSHYRQATKLLKTQLQGWNMRNSVVHLEKAPVSTFPRVPWGFSWVSTQGLEKCTFQTHRLYVTRSHRAGMCSNSKLLLNAELLTGLLSTAPCHSASQSELSIQGAVHLATASILKIKGHLHQMA